MPEVFFADFSGGMNLSPPEDLLQPNECIRAENVVFDELGSIGSGGSRTKQNFTAYNSGGTSIHSLIISRTRNLAGVGTGVLAGSLGSMTSILSAVNPNQDKLSWVDIPDRVIFETGGTPRYIKSTGNPQTVDHIPPSSAPTAADGGAGLLNGTYTWKVTFANEDNHETNASSASNSLNITNRRADLTAIPVSADSKVTKRFIYRTGGNLPVYYQVAEIADNTTTTYTDNKADSTVLTDALLMLADNNRIGGTANVRYPELFFDRVFWVDNSRGNRIIWSKPLNPLAYPTANYFDVGSGGSIFGLVRFLDDLIIIKDDSIWKLSGNTEEDFRLTKTLSNTGSKIPFAVARMRDRVVFLNRNGIWFFDGLTSRPFTNRLDPLFSGGFTKQGVKPFNVETTASWHTTVLNDDFHMAYVESGETTNSKILKVELNDGRISLLNYAADSLAIDGFNKRVYMGSNDGFIYELGNGTDSGSSASVSFVFQTKSYDQIPGNKKHYQAIALEVDTNGYTITPEALYDNGEVTETLSPFATRDRTLKVFNLSAARARKAKNLAVRLNVTIPRSVKDDGVTPAVRLFKMGIYYEPLQQRLKVG